MLGSDSSDLQVVFSDFPLQARDFRHQLDAALFSVDELVPCSHAIGHQTAELGGLECNADLRDCVRICPFAREPQSNGQKRYISVV